MVIVIRKKLIANVIESGFMAIDGIGGRTTFYLAIAMSEQLNYQVFLDSLLCVCNQFDKLRGTLQKGIFHDYWHRKEQIGLDELPVVERYLSLEQNETIEEAFYRQLEQEKNIGIDVEKEMPVKCIHYTTNQVKESMFLFLFHHGLLDGRGAMELLNYIGQCYQDRIEGKIAEPFYNAYSIRKIVQSFPLEEKNRKEKKTQRKRVNAMGNFYQVMEEGKKLRENIPVRSVARFTVSGKDFETLRAVCKERFCTINDLIMYAVLKTSYEIQEQHGKVFEFVGCSTAVDVRRYLPERKKFYGDCAINEIFLVDSEVLKTSDWNEYTRQLAEFKRKTLGRGFFEWMNRLEFVPASIMRFFLEKMMVLMSKETLQKGICISNCGNVENYMPAWSGIMKNAAFFPTINNEGFPQIGVSSYCGELSVTIIKEKDQTGCASQLCNLIEKNLYSIIKM